MLRKIVFTITVLLLVIVVAYSIYIPGKSDAQIKMKQFVPTIIENSPTPTPKVIKIPTLATSIPTIPPVNPTTTIPTNCEAIDMQKLLQDITENNTREYVANLVDDDSIPGHDELRTRASGTIGNRVEADYIKSHYDKYKIPNILQLVPSASSNNIIASIKGKNESEAYLLVGHYDSVTTAAADDNGSGTAIVMEVARAIKKSGYCPNYSLEFINFTGEELGLHGSKYYVQNIPISKKIKGVINLDMLSNPSASGDCVNFVSAAHNLGSVIAQKASEVDLKYGIGLNAKAKSGSVGASDHYPFEVKGMPAVFGTECAFNNAVYHKVTDTSDKINYRQVTNTAKVVAATLVELVGK